MNKTPLPIVGTGKPPKDGQREDTKMSAKKKTSAGASTPPTDKVSTGDYRQVMQEMLAKQAQGASVVSGGVRNLVKSRQGRAKSAYTVAMEALAVGESVNFVLCSSEAGELLESIERGVYASLPPEVLAYYEAFTAEAEGAIKYRNKIRSSITRIQKAAHILCTVCSGMKTVVNDIGRTVACTSCHGSGSTGTILSTSYHADADTAEKILKVHRIS